MIAAAYGLTVDEVSTSSIHLPSRLVIFQPLNVLQVRRVIKVADSFARRCLYPALLAILRTLAFVGSELKSPKKITRS